METSNPALLFWENRPPWRKQHNAFRELLPPCRRQRRRTQCADGKRRTRHVRWCSKPPRSAHEFLCQNKRLTTLTGRSRLFGPTLFSATSPLHYAFYPSNFGGLGVGSAVQRHAAAPWRAWQSVTDGNNQVTRHRYPFQHCSTTQSPARTTPNYTFNPNEQGCGSLKTTGRSPVVFKPHTRSKSPPSKEISTSNFATASPTLPLNAPSSYHNPLHTLVRTSCSPAAKHMKLRIVAFVFQLPGD